MLKDVQSRWIEDISEDALHFFMCTAICDQRFKGLEYFKYFPVTWQAAAFAEWTLRFDQDWSEQNLDLRDSIGTSDVTVKSIVGDFFAGESETNQVQGADVERSCEQERNLYLAMPSIPRQGQ